MKALIVEDDFTSRVLLQKLLNPYGETHVATNGKEALMAIQAARLDDEPYDLVCLDIMMPKMDGQAALKEIRRTEAAAGIDGLSGVKVLMTTALDDSKSIAQAFREQCEGYLIKPIRKDKLLEQLLDLGLIEKTEA